MAPSGKKPTAKIRVNDAEITATISDELTWTLSGPKNMSDRTVRHLARLIGDETASILEDMGGTIPPHLGEAKNYLFAEIVGRFQMDVVDWGLPPEGDIEIVY